MLLGSSWRLARNISTGRRWAPIPKPPPSGFDRVYGLRSVLNILRVAQQAEGRCHPRRSQITCLYLRDFSAAQQPANVPAHPDDDPAAPGDSADYPNEPMLASPGAPAAATARGSSLIPPGYPVLQHILRLAKALSVPVKLVERNELTQLCGERRNQNIVLEVASYSTPQVSHCHESWWCTSARATVPSADVDGGASSVHPALTGLGDSAAGPRGTSALRCGRTVILLLDHIIDPMNIGSLLRSAYFFGVTHVVLGRYSARCTAAVARASVGSLEYLQVHRSSVDTAQFLRNTRQTFALWHGKHINGAGPLADTRWGLRIIGTDAKAGSSHVGATQPQSVLRDAFLGDVGQGEVVILVLGNEDSGLTEAVLSECTHHITIPPGRAARHGGGLSGLSLNVGTAGALLLSKLCSDVEPTVMWAVARDGIAATVSDGPA